MKSTNLELPINSRDAYTCEAIHASVKTRASERTNERKKANGGRRHYARKYDFSATFTRGREIFTREIDCNFYLLLFYWRRKRVPFSMFFFSVSRSRQISSVYVRARARAQHTRDKFFPSRTRSIVRKRKKERKEGRWREERVEKQRRKRAGALREDETLSVIIEPCSYCYLP